MISYYKFIIRLKCKDNKNTSPQHGVKTIKVLHVFTSVRMHCSIDCVGDTFMDNRVQDERDSLYTIVQPMSKLYPSRDQAATYSESESPSNIQYFLSDKACKWSTLYELH